MESMLESKPFDCSMEDIRFGDDNAKVEKAKQSFLQLKQKICRTNDVLQQFSNKSKECEHLRSEVENAKRESEKWKKQHFESLAKNLELKTARIAIEKSNKLLTREKEEMETIVAGNQKLIQQLSGKLEDIEDEHSVKMMELDLQKSGLQTKVAELEKEIKVLHKTYGIKKDKILSKNIEKPRKGRKIKSPIKTTRSTGLLPEIDDEMNFDVEETVPTSTPQHPANSNAVSARHNEADNISTNFDHPKLFDVSNDKLDIIPGHNLLERIPIPKPITCDKNTMTDEFYGTKNDVYPLLCDKCEAQLESMPVDKIFKIMTTLPPLLSTVPPSPVRSRPVDREIQTVDIPQATNISVQSDSNVSLVLDKVQQTLETLEKQMKRSDKRRRNDQNIMPHCSHTLPTNCCNHNNDLANDKNLSQVNMMTALWSSMMKFADKRIPKRHIKRKKKSIMKSKHRKEMTKKLKHNLNSWIVESDASLITDHDSSTNLTPTEPSTIPTVTEYSERITIENKGKCMFSPFEKESENTEIPLQNTSTNHQIFPEISPHINDDENSVHNEAVMNSFTNAITSTPSSQIKNVELAMPKIITGKIARSLPTDSTNTPLDVDPTARKQMRPSNVTQSIPRSRTGLLQKLRRLNKNNKPVTMAANMNKAADFLEPSDEGNVLPVEKVPETKKRIAHVNQKASKEPREIMNNKRTKVTRSMAKSEEVFGSMSPKSPTIESVHLTKSPKCSNEKVKSKRVSRSAMNNLFGNDDYDGKNGTEKTEDKFSESTVSDVVDNITKCTTDIANASKCAEKHNELLNTLDMHSSIKIDESKSAITNISTSSFDTISQNVKVPLMCADEKDSIGIESYVAKIVENDAKISKPIENIPDCLLDKMEIDPPNESAENQFESPTNVENIQHCETKAQIINSPVNFSMTNALSAINTLTTPRSIGTRSMRTLSTESINLSSDENGKTLQKRRRTDSHTKTGCERTPEFSTEKMNQLNKFTGESELISPKSYKKKSVPEIIQNEIGRFFTTKRIMTRSMKKSEESSSPNLDKPQIIKLDSIKRLGSPKKIENTKTPVKSTNNTPRNISRNFVKNLFSGYNSEKKNSDSNIEDDSMQFEVSAINSIKTADSITIDSDTHDNKTESKSELTINHAISASDNVSQGQATCELPFENKIKIAGIVDEERLVLNTHDKEIIVKDRLPGFASEKSYCDNNLTEISIGKQTSNMENSTHKLDTDKQISDITSTDDYDSPLSPDPIPVGLPDCPKSPDSNAPLEIPTTAVNEITYINAISLSTDPPIHQPSNIIRLRAQKNIATATQLSKDTPEYCNGSVRELRNRIVPVFPRPVPTASKNHTIISCTNGKVDENVENIKSLLEKHLSILKVTDMRLPKHYTLPAKKASDEFIEKLKQDIMRFTNLPNWDNSVFQSVVDNISRVQSSKSITRAITLTIEECSMLDEPTDHTHTPPAPPMTMSQQKIIAIITELEKVKPDLFLLIMNAFNFILFHVKRKLELEQIKSFAKIFIVLSKIKKDRQRVRLMICDAMYSLQSRSIVIVHTALTCWPEVLPMYDENRRDCLTMCIVHLIKYYDTKITSLTTTRNQLKNLVKVYYKYPDGNPLSTLVVDELLEEMTAVNYDRNVLTAILLLAKREGTEWTYKNIIKERLLKIIMQNKNSSAYKALILLGWLMKCFPLQDADGSVKNIAEQLCGLLNGGTAPIDIQEGTVMALILLGSRHTKYPSILKSILMWQPPRPLSPALRKQLEILFNSRTHEEWQRIKNK